MPLASKFCRVVNYDGKTQPGKSREKLKNFYLHFNNIHDSQTW